MGVAGAAVIVLAAVLSHWNITMTSDTVAALGVLFGATFHTIADWQKSRSSAK